MVVTQKSFAVFFLSSLFTVTFSPSLFCRFFFATFFVVYFLPSYFLRIFCNLFFCRFFFGVSFLKTFVDILKSPIYDLQWWQTVASTEVFSAWPRCVLWRNGIHNLTSRSRQEAQQWVRGLLCAVDTQYHQQSRNGGSPHQLQSVQRVANHIGSYKSTLVSIIHNNQN